jgi:spore coat protein U-like protein
MMRRISMGISAAVMVVLAGGVSAAQQTASKQADLKVTANVVGNCLISTTDVAFGNYDPVGANATAPADAAGSVDVTCIRGVVATIVLDLGTNASAAVRRMGDGATSRLEYELYRDAARSQVWGTGTNAMVLAAAPSNARRTFPVYGRVRQAQNVQVGSYTDTVVVTVSF